jgi:Tfp pilus assembly protein PilZ
VIFGEFLGKPSKGAPIDKSDGNFKTMKDIERLEKQGWQLWLLTIFLILILTLFIVINYFDELRGSPREFLKHITFLDTYVIASAILIVIFCGYMLKKNLELRRLRREIFAQRIKPQHMVGTLEDITAIFQISSMISGHKDLPVILEAIARESLHCLKAHRSTIFLMDGKSGILKSQYTATPNPVDEQVGLFEEKEVARKVLRQTSPLLLREPKDFADFFKYEERERKITSLLCIPLWSRGKAVGALSVALINGERSFGENDQQFLSIFSNHASIAIENANLQEEVRKETGFRKSYEGYLDDILNQVQNLPDEERGRIEQHIGRLMQGQKTSEKQFIEPHIEKRSTRVEGEITLAGESGVHRGQDDRADGMLRVEFADASLGLADDLTLGGVFIRTPNPMELGEQIVLKLHMSDGGEPIEVACKVIWTNKYGQESKHLRRGMGVKFLNLTEDVKNRVEEYLKSQKKKESSLKVRKAPVSGIASERKKPKGAG